MKKARNDIGKHRKIIFAEDFNAETSVVLEKANYNGKNIVDDKICNDNGQRLKSFCRAKNLCFPQSYFSNPLELRYTWYSCDGKTKKVLDYVLTSSFVQQYITDCVVYPDFKADSDHRLLVTSLNTPRNKISRWKPKKKKSIKPINLDTLNNIETKSAFIKKTERYFQHSKKINSTPSEISDNLIDAFQLAARDTLPNKISSKSSRIWRDDVEINKLFDQRMGLSRASLEFKLLSKQIKRRISAALQQQKCCHQTH